MRHIMGLKGDREPVDPADVDAGVGHHDYPIVISSMSFGSQSEPAFRAYAEAAKAINILCVNGEGGEIRDMYGQYRKWRGQQVASGRFGVSAEMLNSSYVAEIKIGQGAKPGEGGHLPGKKVSEKVAAARNAAPGTDLISPSNNHDLYSIEDLAELIDELKTVNPDVRVSVKVPVVPNIGTIGLGIAKAGADIITLSGFEGGTGAARQHALRHVGLPSRHRHPRRAPGADGGRASATGSRSGPTAATGPATTSSSCTASAPTGSASAPWRWSASAARSAAAASSTPATSASRPRSRPSRRRRSTA